MKRIIPEPWPGCHWGMGPGLVARMRTQRVSIASKRAIQSWDCSSQSSLLYRHFADD